MFYPLEKLLSFWNRKYGSMRGCRADDSTWTQCFETADVLWYRRLWYNQCCNILKDNYSSSILVYLYFTYATSAPQPIGFAPPRTKLRTMGDRALQPVWSCAAAPHLWNCLPDHLRTPQTTDAFKKGLKTFLLKKAFNSNVVCFYDASCGTLGLLLAMKGALQIKCIIIIITWVFPSYATLYFYSTSFWQPIFNFLLHLFNKIS